MKIFQSAEESHGTQNEDSSKLGHPNQDEKLSNQPYQLPLDSTEDLENMSNINIAQSMVGSMDMKVDQEQTQKGAPTKNLESERSNIIDQQYNWLMKNNVDQKTEVINE